jgi:phosphoenolpyruvate synthase/pyruvate phosphate dikinase
LLLVVDLLDKWLRYVCKKNNLSLDMMKWLSVDEVMEVINNHDKEYLKKAENYFNKKQRYGVMSAHGYEDTAPERYEQARKSYSSEQSEIRGICACKGIVKARARVILDVQKEGSRLKTGEILITSMTRPEFVPLMHKASAIVTDEGGMTCHAAIVARELNKPCIIGARVAVNLIHDGDLVEVDANTGIVKILERAK